MSKLIDYIKSLAEWDHKAPSDIDGFLARLRARYADPPIPPCRLCGGELSLHAAGPTGTTWYCDGFEVVDGVRQYQAGRKCVDDHFSASVHRVYRHGDEDVIALIDAFEATFNARSEKEPGQRRSGVSRRKTAGRRK